MPSPFSIELTRAGVSREDAKTQRRKDAKMSDLSDKSDKFAFHSDRCD